jgi:hypothetical protein
MNKKDLLGMLSSVPDDGEIAFSCTDWYNDNEVFCQEAKISQQKLYRVNYTLRPREPESYLTDDFEEAVFKKESDGLPEPIDCFVIKLSP